MYQVTSYKGVLVVKEDKLEQDPKPRDKVVKRGKVRGFSRKSRKNLLRLVNELEPSDCYYFVTLTYRQWEDDNAKLWHYQLKRIFEGLRFSYPTSSGVWRLEFQKRKAPHFHILLHVPQKPEASDLRERIKTLWCRILGQSSWAFKKHSVDCKHVGSDYKSCALYSAIYSAKDANDRPDINTGRQWGKYNEKHLPKKAFSTHVLCPLRQTVLRRICRKWMQAHNKRHGYARYLKSKNGSFDIFMPASEQARLLQFVKTFEVGSLVSIPNQSRARSRAA